MSVARLTKGYIQKNPVAAVAISQPTLAIPAFTVGTEVGAVVTGFDAGTTNNIYIRLITDAWPTTPTAVADSGGLVTITLSPGTYYGKVESVKGISKVSGVTDPIIFKITSAIRPAVPQNELPHTPAVILRTHLLLAFPDLFSSAGSGSDWPLYVSSLPDGKNVESNAAAVYDTSGVKDGRLMEGPTILHHGIQFRIRATDYQEGWLKANALQTILGALKEQTVIVGTANYIINSLTQATQIIPLGQEEGTKRRELFTINYMVTLKEV